jgi:hypothetical protein
MAPLIAEARMVVVAAEALFGPARPEAAVIAVTPVGVSAAAEIRTPFVAAMPETPIVAAMPEAALAVVALVADIPRHPVEIALQMPALAAAHISIGPECPFFPADITRLALKASGLTAREITLPYPFLDTVLLHALACIDAALALGSGRRNGNHAREQGGQNCIHCDASHVDLHFRLMPQRFGLRVMLDRACKSTVSSRGYFVTRCCDARPHHDAA